MLEFGPILAWYRFPATEECFSFNDAPNVLYRWNIWTAGQFSSQTLLLRSHAVVIAAVCGFYIVLLKYTSSGGWCICCSKTFIYLSAFWVPSKSCKLPILYTLMHHIPSEMLLLNWKLVTRWKVSLLFSPEDTVSVISNKNVKFVIAGSNPVNLKQVCRFQMHRLYSNLDVALVVMCMQVQFELWHDKESYCYFCKHNISPMKARTSINYTPSLERSWREQVLIVSERALCAHNTPYYIPLPNDPRNTQPYFWENRPQLHVTPRHASMLQLKEVLGGSASAESVSRNARSHIFSF